MRRGLETLATRTEDRLSAVQIAVGGQLERIRDANDKKLEEMRTTVAEKLEGTLERRLGESFRTVSDRLEQVHKGLGEMQNLASGVGDLKRMMTNVKSRGVWGEIQLGSLLEQFLSPAQYAQNLATVPGTAGGGWTGFTG